MEGTHQHHFLIVTYPAQGHINPAIHLADRLVQTTGARITFSTSIFGHRKMFPNLTSIDQEVDEGGPITYILLANGYDEGFNPGVDDANQFFSQFKTVGSQSLSSIINTLDSRGRGVDCIIYTFVLSWAADVAHKHGIPSALYWIQPATIFAIYYHSFHGHEDHVAADFLKKQQIEELSKGLKASRRPYLWVLRADCRYEGIEIEDKGENEMVVEWCSQMRVLTHPSIGCFVTHCGWNSTLESLVFGVPTVGVPQWTDQGTNAMLMEREWGNGVRGGVNEDGILNGEELRRCLDLVMGEGEGGMEIRKKAELWKERLAEAVGEGGSSDRSLRKFVHEIY
ncbi:uncharacterized protein A4U43_C01F21670 [Asparagus officinalis]|uniref:Uncharacterized protein n=1 Tax=Asparagus officinalis TaxID=4686 RepID=A0A5P1FSY4_ASPOF|nr:uncharacterized protein A4U43_C01F21670 [Asparagus officinalis]